LAGQLIALSGMTLAEIGRLLGVTKAAVYKILDRTS